jgi:2-polyprenyl-6-methoxyphenol hydroxylase-like FAD-dependent oxidoreductase
MYDAIVIGARCAGAPTAMLLARRGLKVLLLDRARFPREIRHGHFIHRNGPRHLAAWGLLDRIVAGGCPPVDSFTSDLGDFPLTARGLVVDGVAFGYGPRRALLDNVLLQAALEAGAELRDGVSVEEVITGDDRVTGIRGVSQNGRRFTESARLTIGADGRRSRLAALVGAPVHDAHPAVTCWYFSYWSGVRVEGLEHYCRGDRVLFVHPTSDSLTAVFVGCPIDSRPRSAAIEAHVMAAVDRVPPLAERVRDGRREEPFYGAVDLPNFFRRPFGPGWALVGDAGCHKDPYLALGICDAFRDVEWLVNAIDEGLGGDHDLQRALARFETRRNEAGREDYAQNLRAARFEPPPAEILRARATIRGDAAATTRFFLGREGLLAPGNPAAPSPATPSGVRSAS